MRRWMLFACALLVAACSFSFRRPPPAPPRTTKLDVAIRTARLANGLRVVLVRDPRATEVQVTMRYRVGGVDDPPDRQGMAHLVEHLMFQQILGAQSLWAHLHEKASSFNAFTSHDATTYFARARPEHLETLLSIDAVRLGFRCTGLTDSVFEREREVVANEARQSEADTRFWGALDAALFPAGHPYRSSIGGSIESLAAITRDEACKFADLHYAPGNAVLVISGNVAPETVEKTLGKFLGRIPARAVAPSVRVAAFAPGPRELEAEMPIEREALLLAWPVPSDPGERTRFEAFRGVVAAAIDGEIRGRVTTLVLGDHAAQVFAIAIVPAEGEAMDAVITAAKAAMAGAPRGFAIPTIGPLVFDRLRQSAVHHLFQGLEEGLERDARLAEHVLADRDPNAALAAEFASLRDMRIGTAADVTRALSFESAVKVRLKPTPGERPATTDLTTKREIEDRGLRRDPPDPAEADQPIRERAPDVLGKMSTRVLPNGLKVVLLPLTSVPNVDIRLVFGSGTADEPATARGAAVVSAKALTWSMRYLNDLILFSRAGGEVDVDVDLHHTTFAARGVDMHLDVLLAGLRRYTRDARYDGGADKIAETLRRQTKDVEDYGALTDAWRTALFGAGHPYATAGIARHTSPTLGAVDAERFRAAHYTPDNATLVIAGHFDPVLADRWIDYVFADWKGLAAPRVVAPPIAFQPVTLAKVEDLTQVMLGVVVPATAGTRAQQLVAAEMLADVAADVRHQLGASYDLTATLYETPLAKRYFLGGSVDAARADAIVTLLRERIEELRTDQDAARRAFITARRQVLSRLDAIAHGASSLAGQVVRDVRLRRPPMSDVKTATEVRALTIAAMTPVLADLDLSRAAIIARGSQEGLDATFAALGREPTYVRDTRILDPFDAAPLAGKRKDEDFTSSEDFEAPLTEQGPPRWTTMFVAGGLATGRAQGLGTSLSGAGAAGAFGLRLTQANAVGVHVSLAQVSGSSIAPVTNVMRSIDLTSFELGAFVHVTAYDRLWASPVIALRYDTVSINGDSNGEAAVAIGLQGGIDAYRWRDHRIGVYGSLSGVLVSEISYAGFMLGLAYRQH